MTYRKEVSNPFKYRAHYNTKIRAIYSPLSCNVHIEQPAGGIITVVYNGMNYTNDFSVPKGQSIIVKTQINEAYLSNQLSINGEKITPNTKYVVNEDINVSYNGETYDLPMQKTSESAVVGGTLKMTQSSSATLDVTDIVNREIANTILQKDAQIAKLEHETKVAKRQGRQDTFWAATIGTTAGYLIAKNK